MKCVLIGTAKNEGPYIWEWVAYHRAIGFTDIILFQNDSDDFTHQTMKTLRAAGAIEYFYNKAPPGRHQVRAYRLAARRPAFQEADWAMALDLDEFLAIRAGNGHLRDLISAVPACDSLLVNWRIYGNDGHHELTDDLVTERFTRAEDPNPIRGRPYGYKALFRPDAFGRPGIHQPREPKKPEDDLVRVNGSGLGTDAFRLKNWCCTDPDRRRLAQVNHYAVRDTASFLLKSTRGSAHQDHREIGADYFTSLNLNRSSDPVLAERAVQTRAAMQELDGQVHGRLTTMRNRAIRLHRSRVGAGGGGELLEDPVHAELYAKCRQQGQP